MSRIGESADAEVADDLIAFEIVDIADADEGHVCGIYFWGETEEIDQFRWSLTDAAGERHAVDIAAWAGGGRVHVGVGVDPEETGFLIALAERIRDLAADCPPPQWNDRRREQLASVRR